jgi:hypothetical protein
LMKTTFSNMPGSAESLFERGPEDERDEL